MRAKFLLCHPRRMHYIYFGYEDVSLGRISIFSTLVEATVSIFTILVQKTVPISKILGVRFKVLVYYIQKIGVMSIILFPKLVLGTDMFWKPRWKSLTTIWSSGPPGCHHSTKVASVHMQAAPTYQGGITIFQNGRYPAQHI